MTLAEFFGPQPKRRSVDIMRERVSKNASRVSLWRLLCYFHNTDRVKWRLFRTGENQFLLLDGEGSVLMIFNPWEELD